MGVVLSGCAKSPPGDSFPSVPAAPSSTPEPVELTVFAAASLTEAFQEIGEAYAQEHPNVKIIHNFAGSQALRTQLEQGAVADVFASADRKHMEAVAELTEPPQPFAHNVVTVILSKKVPPPVQTLSDLTSPGLKIVMAVEGCPIGDYTRQVLEKLDVSGKFGTGFKKKVLGNVVSNETNVKQVLAKVALGEADVGFVYPSDATEEVAELPIPDEYNVQAEYPIAVLKAGRQNKAAQEYIAWILSEKGQTILQKHRFRPAH